MRRLFASLALTLLLCLSGWATIYYVNTAAAAGGDGTTSALTGAHCAWDTIADVNAASFSAGDSVLFAKGCTWREQLTVPSSGSAGLPITFGAYGTGDDPIITGSDLVITWTNTDIAATTGNLLTEGFEATGYDDANWSETVGSGSVVDEDNTDIARPTGGGNQILKIQKISPNFNAWTRNDGLGGDNNITYTTVYVNITAEGLASGESIVVIDTYDSAWTWVYQVKFKQDGTAYYYYMAVTSGSATSYIVGNDHPVSLGTWHKLGMKHDITNHETAFYQDDLLIGSVALTNVHSGPVAKIALGDKETSKTVTAYFDRLDVSSTGFITEALTLPAGTWKAACASEPNPVWFVGTDAVIHWGTKETVLTNVNAEYDWYYSTSHAYLVVYAATDPDTRYSSVEAAIRNYGINGNSKSYITVQDLEIEFSVLGGIVAIIGTSNWIIGGNIIHHIGVLDADTAEGIWVRGSTATVQDNTVYECGDHGIYINALTGETSNNNIVQDNTVYNIYHSGIDCHSINGTSVDGNVFRRNHIYWDTNYPATDDAMGMYLEGSDITHYPTNIEIYYNLIHDFPAYGIYIAGFVQNTDIYNNDIYGELSGSTMAGGSVGLWIADTTANIKIQNNIVSDLDCCFLVVDKSHVSVCDNNCWYHSADGTKEYARVNSLSYHYDDFIAYKTATGWDTNGLWEDPLMASPATGDFTLQVGSPCINAGTNVGLTEDYAGTKVGAMFKPVIFQKIRLKKPPIREMPDIGAYEYRDR